MDSLPLMDGILTMTGNRLNCRMFGYKITRPVNWINRIAFMTSYAYLFYFVVLMDQNASNISITQRIFYFTAGAMTNFIFASRRENIICLLDRIVTPESGRSVRKLSIMAFLAALTMFTAYSVAELTSSLTSTKSSFTAFIAYLPHNLNNYLLHYPLAYVIMFRILTEYEIIELREIRKSLVSLTSSHNQVCRLKQLEKVRQDFESNLNFIPFVLFGILFLTIPSAMADVSTLSGYKTFLGYFLFLILHHASIGFTIILVVASVTKSRERVNLIVDETIEIIYRSGTHLSPIDQLLIESLKKYQRFSFTGWYLFTIDRSLILTFLSSIVTFSVLLSQLGSSQS